MAAVPSIDGLGGRDSESAVKRGLESGSAVHEQVYLRLRDALITGGLAPGRALSVRRLAAEFDVSAMPAREAIRRLEALGALEFTATRRVMVATMTGEKLDEIKSARLALEPLLSEKSLEHVGRDPSSKKLLVRELERIDAELDASIHRGDVGKYTQLNCDFHFALYRAAQATVLLELVESLWLRFGPFMRVIIGRLGTSCLVDDWHKEIIDAIKANDSKGLAKAVHCDIVHGMDNIDVSDLSESS